MNYYIENKNCTISPPNSDIHEYNESDMILDFNSKNITITNNILLEDELKEFFGIRKLEQQSTHITGEDKKIPDEEIFVNNYRENEICSILEDFEEYFVFLIVIPSTYLIIAICILIYSIKYRKIKKDFLKLRDERDTNSVISKKNQSQLEMSSTNRKAENKEINDETRAVEVSASDRKILN
jgi:hypothetical protein